MSMGGGRQGLSDVGAFSCQLVKHWQVLVDVSCM